MPVSTPDCQPAALLAINYKYANRDSMHPELSFDFRIRDRHRAASSSPRPDLPIWRIRRDRGFDARCG